MALLDMQGRAALVVGGGQGIGRAAAQALARAGAAVAVLDAESERAKAVASELEAEGARALALCADDTRASDAERAVAESARGLGGLDAVIDIVGSASWGSLLELDEATWERDFAVNLKQHWYVARSAARCLIDARRGGALCAVGSVSGVFSAANHGAYGAAKAGLLALVRTAAEEWCRASSARRASRPPGRPDRSRSRRRRRSRAWRAPTTSRTPPSSSCPTSRVASPARA